MKLSERLANLKPQATTAPAVSTATTAGTRLSDRIVSALGGEMPKGKGSRVFSSAFASAGVPRSAETDRIFALPRRVWSETETADITEAMNARFCKPTGTMKLRPLQAVALHEAYLQNGLFAPMGVGSGKTLVTLLLPEAMESKVAVLLVPPQLRNQLTGHDIKFYSQHFRFKWLETGECNLHVIAYSTLSIESGADELERLKPDLIIGDESHHLKHSSATRTKRFLRCFKNRPGTRFCPLSGTMTTRSIRDYAHLCELSLRKNSPLPNNYQTLNDWADAIDVIEGDFNQMQPGILLELCQSGESLRSGFRRRLVETPGVVATSESALGTSLIITEREIEVPDEIKTTLIKVDSTWQRPDGDEIEDPLRMSQVMKQLAAGFYYRWVWPDGVVDHEWLLARKNWHKEVRETLKRAKPGLDSPMLLAKAAIHTDECQNRKGCTRKHFDSLAWAEWAEVKGRPEPPTEAVWIDDYLCQDIANTMQCQTTLVFYEYEAMGQRIAELAHTTALGGGADAEIARIAASPILPSAVASLKAHGHGKNLQAWSNMLYASCPSNGTIWEQSLGRTHRPGQLADEVNVTIYLQTEEVFGAYKKALADAKYIEETTGMKQKLNYASKIVKERIE